MSYGRMFIRGKRRAPLRPTTIPTTAELPLFIRPAKPGAGRYTHWTERGQDVRGAVRRFVSAVLGFKKPVVYTNFKLTGNVDMVAVDKGQAGGPCARFEVKAAQDYIKDVHATKGSKRRAGRFEINPTQHFQAPEGACNLFYVLVPTHGKRVEHVGICTLPMIEDILETKITTRRPVHREAAFECPGVEDWVRARRG